MMLQDVIYGWCHEINIWGDGVQIQFVIMKVVGNYDLMLEGNMVVFLSLLITGYCQLMIDD